MVNNMYVQEKMFHLVLWLYLRSVWFVFTFGGIQELFFLKWDFTDGAGDMAGVIHQQLNQ